MAKTFKQELQETMGGILADTLIDNIAAMAARHGTLRDWHERPMYTVEQFHRDNERVMAERDTDAEAKRLHAAWIDSLSTFSAEGLQSALECFERVLDRASVRSHINAIRVEQIRRAQVLYTAEKTDTWRKDLRTSAQNVPLPALQRFISELREQREVGRHSVEDTEKLRIMREVRNERVKAASARVDQL